jgi:hypothetical protein
MVITYLKKDQTNTKNKESAGIWFNLDEMGKIVKDLEDSAIVPSINDGWMIVIIKDLDDSIHQ